MFGLIGIVIGILLLLVGIFLVFFFPSTMEHQPPGMSVTGVVLGLVLLVVGFVLVFL